MVSWPVAGREQPSPSWPWSSACRRWKELPGRLKQGNSEAMLQSQLLKGFPRVWWLGGGWRGARLVLCSSPRAPVPGLCRDPGTALATTRMAERPACRDARAGCGPGRSSTAGLGERFPSNHPIHPVHAGGMGRPPSIHPPTHPSLPPSLPPSIHPPGNDEHQTRTRNFKTSFQAAEDLCTSHLICCSGHVWR